MIEALKHAYIRHKAGFSQLPTSRFSIRLATDTEDYLQAFNLVQVSYAYLGIEELGTKMLRMTEQHILPEAFVLIAEEMGRVVGTITVVLDSLGGLPLDKDYPEMLGALRGLNAKIAEIGAFAVVQNCRHSGLSSLLVLAASRLVWAQKCTHTVIGVHPKAVPLHRALWGYQRCGDSQAHASLAAPVSALAIGAGQQRDHVRSRLGRHRPSARTLEDLMFGKTPIPNTNLDARHTGEREGLVHGRRPRMTRATFQELFLERSDHLCGVGPETLAHARRYRSDETLGFAEPSSSVEHSKAAARLNRPVESFGAEQSGLTWLN